MRQLLRFSQHMMIVAQQVRNKIAKNCIFIKFYICWCVLCATCATIKIFWWNNFIISCWIIPRMLMYVYTSGTSENCISFGNVDFFCKNSKKYSNFVDVLWFIRCLMFEYQYCLKNSSKRLCKLVLFNIGALKKKLNLIRNWDNYISYVYTP